MNSARVPRKLFVSLHRESDPGRRLTMRAGLASASFCKDRTIRIWDLPVGHQPLKLQLQM